MKVTNTIIYMCVFTIGSICTNTANSQNAEQKFIRKTLNSEVILDLKKDEYDGFSMWSVLLINPDTVDLISRVQVCLFDEKETPVTIFSQAARVVDIHQRKNVYVYSFEFNEKLIKNSYMIINYKDDKLPGKKIKFIDLFK